MTCRRFAFALLIAAALLIARPAHGRALPAVNLGLTSFLDGGPPAGPGFYYQQYLQFYHADQFTNGNGDDTNILDDLDVWVSLNQFIYQSDQPVLLGGKWGLDVIVPIVGIDVNPGLAPLSDNGAGLGDVLVGPFVQWDPIMGERGPIFMHRVELQCIFPTGKYDRRESLNPGANVFSFNPYWAGTLFISPKWTASCRAHYLWNSENEDPAGAASVQPGQAIHVNFATAYEVIEKKLHAGFNGYYLTQISDAQVNGVDVGMREEVLGVGPGAVWRCFGNDYLFFNAYFEPTSANRPEGARLVLRWTHHF